MKKGILLVAVLFAVASMMGAFAYNTATVTNDSAVKVVATDQALLTLAPMEGIGNKDATCVVNSNNELEFKFGMGKVLTTGGDEVFIGLQPNSEYIWDRLFRITNKSKETVKITVEATGSLKNIVYFGAAHTDAFPNGAPWDTWYKTTHTYSNNLGSGDTGNVAVKIDLPSGKTLGDYNGKIIVKAVAQ